MALLGLMWPWYAKIAQPLLALLYRIFKLKFCQGFLSWSFVNILKLKLSRFWNWRFVKKPAVDNVDKISFDTAYPLGGGWGSAGWWCKKVIWPLFLPFQTILRIHFLSDLVTLVPSLPCLVRPWISLSLFSFEFCSNWICQVVTGISLVELLDLVKSLHGIV